MGDRAKKERQVKMEGMLEDQVWQTIKQAREISQHSL